ncbi:unnamed protein product [Eruca vesicaria subsp. sativa]|uniref:Uncharacterized protein n=1 Tax=Eruca vesicaria subsp. sativa TaxID=29727 RepID=A0ABC8J2J5_ERUVS|nr:unnamed protein product [Eruca vesicaria subsp. sativa]
MEFIWEDGTIPRSSDSSSAIQKRSVTLTLTPDDVRACKLNEMVCISIDKRWNCCFGIWLG